MKKANRIIYWVATLWLSLGMVSTGIVQIIKMQEEVDDFTHLGYPTYLMTIIGISKLAGVIAVLAPGLPLIKEWAYAGFLFITAGAVTSHIISGSSASSILGPALLLVLTIVSWYFRPPDRKVGTGQ